MTRRLRVLRLGLFDRCYVRNRTTAAALAACGAEIADLHAPVIESLRDRLRPARSPEALARLGLTILRGEARLLAGLAPWLQWADVVLFGYPGQWDAALWGGLVRSAGRTVVFDPLVTLTETFVEDRRLLSPGSWQACLVRALDRRAFRTADIVLADTPQQAAYWAALSGLPLERFVVLPVGADEELFCPDRHRQNAVRQDDPSCLRVLFYGTYSPLHGAETIVQAVHQLERAGERLAVTMIGKGQCRAQVERLAHRLGLQSVRFLDWVPEEELPAWIARSDVVLGIFGATAKAARVVPNKVYQAMAMGAAVVTRDSPAMRWLLGSDESVLLVPPEDPASLAAALFRLGEAEYRSALGEAARRRFRAVASLAARAACLRAFIGGWSTGDGAGTR